MTTRRAVAAVALALGAAAVAVAAASAIATARFRERYEAEKAALLRRGRAGGAAAAPAPAREPLPRPVQRYLELARPGPAAAVAVLEQRGALRTAPDGPWLPFVAEQAYSMDPPGFVWHARAELAPLVHLVARDAFVDGRGHMLVRVLGLVTVADARGPELDRGAALRYWGEVISFPERVLDPRVRWEALDDRRARMLVEHDGLELAGVVEFGEDGLPAAFLADRFREVGGESVLTPWSGHFREWKELDGRRYPTRWEAVWHLPEGDFSAVAMEILRVRSEGARPEGAP